MANYGKPGSLLAFAHQAVEAIKHLRETGKDWSPDQKQAFLNGIEQSGRKAIEKEKRNG